MKPGATALSGMVAAVTPATRLSRRLHVRKAPVGLCSRAPGHYGARESGVEKTEADPGRWKRFWPSMFQY